MPYQISDPGDIPRLQQILNTLQAEIAEREQATAALARQNAALYGELRRRLAESESFNRVLVSLLQKTVLEQVLDIVCAEAQSLIGATGSAMLAADRSGLAGGQASLGQAVGGRRTRACGWLVGGPGRAPGCADAGE